MAKKALVFIAPGSNEMELVIPVDVLRRGGVTPSQTRPKPPIIQFFQVEVTVGGVPDANPIKCAHEVVIKPDVPIAGAKGPFDVMILPGGLGGAKNLAQSKEVGQMLKEQEKAGRFVAAICAGPTALRAHEIGFGKSITSFPNSKGAVMEGGKYKYKEDRVVIDGKLITSRGPGTACDFALNILEQLQGKDKAVEVAKAMLLNY